MGELDETLPDVSGADFEINWSDIQPGAELGRGANGVVIMARWQGSTVAVKRLIKARWTDMNEDAAIVDAVEVSSRSKALKMEASAMARIRHPNLVHFYGHGNTLDGFPFLVSEFMPNGTLQSMLKDTRDSVRNNRKVLIWSDRYELTRDIAAGMQFLHSRSPPMVHRDLKGDNCLLSTRADGSYVVKIADFGSLTLFDSHARNRESESLDFGSARQEGTLGVGTPEWMAPEMLQGKYGKASYGPSVDVYSFGIVMYQIATGMLPFEDVPGLDDVHALQSHVAAGGRPSIPPGCNVPGEYRYLMESCWSGGPAARPTFQMIVAALASNGSDDHRGSIA